MYQKEESYNFLSPQALCISFVLMYDPTTLSLFIIKLLSKAISFDSLVFEIHYSHQFVID